MHWTDPAIILSVRKLGEHAAVVRAFSQTHGLVAGVCRGAYSKAARGIYQSGNKVELRWQARLSEQLGTVSAEMVEGIAAYFMDSRYKLAALHSACMLIEHSLMERDPHPELYDALDRWIIAAKQEGDWLGGYVRFELELLKNTGFGLDVTRCAATGTSDNLMYVSPKSGRAVCAEAGRPYHEKLLPLPAFLIKNEEFCGLGYQQTIDGMRLTGYFLEHRVLESKGGRLPDARVRFLQLLRSSLPNKDITTRATTQSE